MPKSDLGSGKTAERTMRQFISDVASTPALQVRQAEIHCALADVVELQETQRRTEQALRDLVVAYSHGLVEDTTPLDTLLEEAEEITRCLKDGRYQRR